MTKKKHEVRSDTKKGIYDGYIIPLEVFDLIDDFLKYSKSFLKTADEKLNGIVEACKRHRVSSYITRRIINKMWVDLGYSESHKRRLLADSYPELVNKQFANKNKDKLDKATKMSASSKGQSQLPPEITNPNASTNTNTDTNAVVVPDVDVDAGSKEDQGQLTHNQELDRKYRPKPSENTAQTEVQEQEQEQEQPQQSQQDEVVRLKAENDKLQSQIKSIEYDRDQYKKNSERIWDEFKALKMKYNICEMCDKKAVKEVTKPYGNDPYGIRYCNKHLKDYVKFNEKMGPRINNMLGKMMGLSSSTPTSKSEQPKQPKQRISFASYSEAAKYVQEHGIKSRSVYRKQVKIAKEEGEINLPMKPDEHYKDSGWKDWNTFYGIGE